MLIKPTLNLLEKKAKQGLYGCQPNLDGGSGALDDIQLVTIIMALYGALLSTSLAAYKFYENWRRLKVKLSYGSYGPSSGSYGSIRSGPSQIYPVLLLSCSNLGKRPITLNSYGFALPNKRNYFFQNESSQSFPCTLSDGQGCIMVVGSKKVTELLIQEGYKNSVQIKGFFGDASDKKHYGKKFKFSIR